MSEVLDRMKTALGLENAQEGSFLLDNIAAVAQEIDRIQELGIDFMPNRFFPTLATGDDLTRACANFGVERKAATPAHVTLTFSGDNGATVDETVQAACGELIYQVAEEKTIQSGTASVEAVCLTDGAAGNVLAGQITELVTTYDGVTGVTNLAAAYGGTDTESDADLLLRLKTRWQAPSTGGNASDYKRWALEVLGVSRARVFNPSAGNVSVYIVATGAQEAGQALIDDVTEHIALYQPIGATVTVASGAAEDINITATVTLEDGYEIEDVSAEIEAKIEAFLEEKAFETSVISYAQIATLLLVDGVSDVVSYTLNGGTSSVTLEDTEFGTKGTVSISVA